MKKINPQERQEGFKDAITYLMLEGLMDAAGVLKSKLVDYRRRGQLLPQEPEPEEGPVN